VPLPDTIGEVTDSDVAPDGSVAILDGIGLGAWVITPNNGMRKFGRSGAGPGEFRRPRDIEISDDLLVVYDQANGTAVWERSGDLRSTEPTHGLVQLELFGDSLFMWRPLYAGLGGRGSRAYYALRSLSPGLAEGRWRAASLRTDSDSVGFCYGCDVLYEPETRTLDQVNHGDARILRHVLGSDSAELFPDPGRVRPPWMQTEWAARVASALNHRAYDIPPAPEGVPAPLNYEGESAGLDDNGRRYLLVRAAPRANSVVDVWQEGVRIATLSMPFRARRLTVQGNDLYAIRHDELGSCVNFFL